MSEDVPCPDPNEVVTRAILREELTKELTKELAKYATKDDLHATEQRLLRALQEEISRSSLAAQEWALTQFKVLDPVRDAPQRIANHEERLADHEQRIVGLERTKPATRRRARTTTRKRTRTRR